MVKVSFGADGSSQGSIFGQSPASNSVFGANPSSDPIFRNTSFGQAASLGPGIPVFGDGPDFGQPLPACLAIILIVRINREITYPRINGETMWKILQNLG